MVGNEEVVEGWGFIQARRFLTGRVTIDFSTVTVYHGPVLLRVVLTQGKRRRTNSFALC
jgi:hypothetical protein